MIKKLKLHFAAAVLLASGLGGLVGAVSVPANVSADCTGRVLGFVRWYNGLVNTDTCELVAVGNNPGQMNIGTFVWGIAGNVADIMLTAVSYLAIFYILYGAFLIISSSGTPDKRAQGQKAVLQASVGLVIALSAIAIMNTMFSIIGGGSGAGFTPGASEAAGEGVIRRLLNLVYWIIGVVSVVVIIASGIMYASSTGDQAKITKAKNALLGAVIGLVVAIAAFAITSLIINTVGDA